MTRTCPECGRQYDDIYRLTHCPHEEFPMRTVVLLPGGREAVATSLEELDALMCSQAPAGKHGG